RPQSFGLMVMVLLVGKSHANRPLVDRGGEQTARADLTFPLPSGPSVPRMRESSFPGRFPLRCFMRLVRMPFLALIILTDGASLRADSTPSPDFKPDPKSVQHYGPAYRYPRAGWVVLHIEGEPYERGYQHGKLMAPEIAAYIRPSAAIRSSKAPDDGWR